MNSLAVTLRIASALVMTIGVVAGILFLVNAGESTLFDSRGELTLTEVLIGVAIMFYHFLLGLLCLGMSRIIEEVTDTQYRHDSHQAGVVEHADPGGAPSANPVARSRTVVQTGLTTVTCQICGKQMRSTQTSCPHCGARRSVS